MDRKELLKEFKKFKKQFSDTGINRDQFRQMAQTFLPEAQRTTAFIDRLFNAFDSDRSGTIDFQVSNSLSLLCSCALSSQFLFCPLPCSRLAFPFISLFFRHFFLFFETIFEVGAPLMEASHRRLSRAILCPFAFSFPILRPPSHFLLLFYSSFYLNLSSYNS